MRIPTQLPAYLRAIRRQRGLTQKDMARKLGMTQQALSQLERNAPAASFERIARYCKVLNVIVVLRDSEDIDASQTKADW